MFWDRLPSAVVLNTARCVATQVRGRVYPQTVFIAAGWQRWRCFTAIKVASWFCLCRAITCLTYAFHVWHGPHWASSIRSDQLFSPSLWLEHWSLYAVWVIQVGTGLLRFELSWHLGKVDSRPKSTFSSFLFNTRYLMIRNESALNPLLISVSLGL